MNSEIDKHDSTLINLAMNLQNTAMIQLGKIVEPTSGEIVRDLESARFSIDILEMLKSKCQENTHQDILGFLEKSVMELQLNYLDEMKKEKPEQGDDSDQDVQGEAAPADEDKQDGIPAETPASGEED